MNHQQMALDISLRDDLDFEHFIAGHNEELVNQLVRIAQGATSVPVMFIWGASGSGKTHLLNACYRASVKQGRSALFVALADAADGQGDASLLDTASQYSLFCLDGLDHVAGNVSREEKLFQLCNFARDNDRSVILTAERPPTHLGLALRDLVTRLMSGLTYQVLPLNDAQKISALQERAMHRGFELPTAAAQYLLDRCHRQTGHLFDILDRLDRASLEQKRVVTIPFLRSLELE